MITQGLNGFWGSFWGGFKSVFTATTQDDNTGGFWAMIGRKVGKLLDDFTYNIAGGAFRVLNYIPTTSELAILNPIKIALNNWIISLTDEIDNLLKTGNTNLFLNKCNLAVGQMQLIKEYYYLYQLPGLSIDAQSYLIEQVDLMLIAYQASIENLLSANNITFTKSDYTITKTSSDNIPAVIIIPNNLQITGFRYDIPETNNGETPTISAQTTISDSITVAASNTTTTPQNSNLFSNGAFKKVAFAIASAFLLNWAFKSNNSKNLNKKT